MDEFFIRATAVKQRVDRLSAEARRCLRNPERLAAIEAEMAQAVQALEDIREEQLVSMLPKPKRPPWWRRLFRREVLG